MKERQENRKKRFEWNIIVNSGQEEEPDEVVKSVLERDWTCETTFVIFHRFASKTIVLYRKPSFCVANHRFASYLS